jgi:hypothetical protein
LRSERLFLGRGDGRTDILSVVRRRVAAVDLHTSFPGVSSHAALEDGTLEVEGIQLLNGISDLVDLHALAPVDVKHLDEDVVDLGGDGEDGGEEVVGVTEVSLESGVIGSRRLPWVATSREVEKDNTEGPDVVEHRGVLATGGESSTLTFWRKKIYQGILREKKAKKLTWAHVRDTSGAELVAELISGSQTKVSDGDPEAIVETQNIFGLQVAMINTERVAIFHSVEHLQKDILDEGVVSEIATVVEDLRK